MVIFLIIAGIIILVTGIIVYYLWSNYSPVKVIRYIAENPTNGSIYLVRNGLILLDKNSDNLMPLASTVKIIIAIEFARQAAAKKIDADEYILLSDLDKYYIKNTDGGAHAAWLKSIIKNQLIKNKSITISEVVRGMIEFSSNADSEYLMDRLGFDNVNKVLRDLNLENHEQLYPFVSCLFVLRDHSSQELREMKKDEYIRLSHEVHGKLKDNNINKVILKKKITKEKLKLFSKLLTQGTTKEYGSILRKLNARDYFSDKEYGYIDDALTIPFSSSDVIHGREKGGSTSFILTMAFYETTRDGNKTELALLS